jgi:hypothetical protein
MIMIIIILFLCKGPNDCVHIVVTALASVHTRTYTYRLAYQEYYRSSGVLDIQGDSGEICNTLGNDSMCDSKKKSSYEYGSDFERLRSYDRLKLRIEGTDY